jgi:hypothetical protein
MKWVQRVIFMVSGGAPQFFTLKKQVYPLSKSEVND